MDWYDFMHHKNDMSLHLLVIPYHMDEGYTNCMNGYLSGASYYAYC